MQMSPVQNSLAPGPIEVKLGSPATGEPRVFSSAFRIGRGDNCEVYVRNEYVSRIHAEVAPEWGGWRIKDLNSSNGLFWHGVRVPDVLVTASEVIRLGVEGPELSFQVRKRQPPEVPAPAKPANPEPAAAAQSENMEEYVKRYFRAPVQGEAEGMHTGYVRRAFVEI